MLIILLVLFVCSAIFAFGVAFDLTWLKVEQEQHETSITCWCERPEYSIQSQESQCDIGERGYVGMYI